MDLNVSTKSVLVAVAVCTLVTSSILSAIPFVKPVYGVKACDDYAKRHNKGTDWRDGCTVGVSDCRGGSDYNPGHHSKQYHEGYDWGWKHAGC